MHISQTGAEHVDEGIPPLCQLHESEQQDVQRVMVQDVPFLVEKDFVPVVGVVLLADDDRVHPAAWLDIVGVAINGDAAIFLVFPYCATSYESFHVDELPEAKQKHEGDSYQIDDGHPI